MDLYYAPEVVDVPYTGHSKIIYGRIYLHTQTNCGVVQGGMGGGTTPAVLGAATTAPVAAVAPAATLTDTGLPVFVTMLLGFVNGGAALFVSRLGRGSSTN